MELASTARLDVVDDAYLTQAQHLLPPGRAWTRAPGRVLTRLLSAISYEFSRVHRRARRLLEEMDPRTTRELLTDWERVTGLPACTTPTTIEGRRAAVHAKLLGGAGLQDKAFFAELAAALGYTIEIRDRLAPFTCVSPCTDALYQGTWVFVWEVVTSSGDHDELLECVMREHAPSHTHVVFTYE